MFFKSILRVALGCSLLCFLFLSSACNTLSICDAVIEADNDVLVCVSEGGLI